MIKTETITINGKDYTRTYSDAGMIIEREGARYSEAIDPIDIPREYTETDAPIEIVYATEIEEKAAAYDILVGARE